MPERTMLSMIGRSDSRRSVSSPSVQKSFVSKLYWPECSGRGVAPGLLIGWNIRNFVACVVAVVPGNDLAVLERALSQLMRDPGLARLWVHTMCPPTVIGNCVDSAAASTSVDPVIEDRMRTANFWATVDVSATLPSLTNVYCCGFLYKTCSQILLYNLPAHSNAYLSDERFTFDPSAATAISSDNTNVTDLQFVLRQINAAAKVEELLYDALASSGPDSASTSPRRSSASASLRQRRLPDKRSDDRAPTATSSRPASWLTRCSTNAGRVTWFLFRVVFSIIQLAMNAPMPQLVGGGRLKDRSAVLQQLDRRISELTQLMEFWLHSRATTWQTKCEATITFIRFWSSLSQLLADIIAGLLIGVLLRGYSAEFLQGIHVAGQILHVDVLRRQIIWLMGFPAGMKLNLPLDQALGAMVLYEIDFWNSITTVLTPLEPMIISLVSIVGATGASMSVACAIDLLSTMTTHILFVHTAFSRLYSLALSALSALSKLFSGKKHNILQHRIDSCHFEVDQLLLGTILFTLIFFLFPTVAIYYLFFAIVRFLIMLVEALLWMVMCFFNFFPFFELGVYFVDRGRLPSGIRLEVLDNSTSQCAYLRLHNSEIPIGTIFENYVLGMQRLLQRYSLGASLRGLLYGLPIPVQAAVQDEEEDVYMDFSPGITGFWIFLKTHLNQDSSASWPAAN
ncbi:N-acetylglucosaminyl transferase component (Gpi1) [Plasmodiophora brassicae]|nr:hypothetical protein PBRA_009124 [Plasmodiophora brassicae]